MASDTSQRNLRGHSVVLLTAAVLLASGCATTDPRRFALAAPVLRDQDLDLVAIKCHRDPSKDNPTHEACWPENYESSFAWDGADNLVFRPISKFFQVDPGHEAKNVNAFDEVPDSSWFVNRIGVKPMAPEEAARGYCPEGDELHDDPVDGAWTIDHGKDNGANPGFRVNVNGTKFMLKIDDDQAERATAATAIATRLYYSAGWWAPCDSVVYFKRSALKLKPGLTVKANVGAAKPFDDAALTKTLEKAGRRGDLYRAGASRWIPGKPLGPFTYEGVRKDDPSDVIPHEDRRDLRGARVLAAWTNHFDSREQNSMATWMQTNEKDPKSQGYVRHWYIDLGDCFGSEWTVDGFSRRFGSSTVLDVGDILGDFATLGIREEPWERASRFPGAENFGYFSAKDFDPDRWVGEYGNPAFGRATEHDNAWATRIIARFTPEHVAAAARVGNLTKPEQTAHLVDVIVERQKIILRRYFSKLSSVADVSVEGTSLCAVDLARKTNTYSASAFRYAAEIKRGRDKQATPLPVTVEDKGRLCVSLTHMTSDAVDNDPTRYVVMRIANGASEGPLFVHLYDLGSARGFRVVGIERL